MQKAYEIKFKRLGPNHNDTLEIAISYVKLLCQGHKLNEGIAICIKIFETAANEKEVSEPIMITLQYVLG